MKNGSARRQSISKGPAHSRSERFSPARHSRRLELQHRQAAKIIGRIIGKQLRFVDESPEQSRARRQREGYLPKIIESALAISAYQRAGGKTETITSVVADLTGRPPRTVAEFVRDHAAEFRGLKPLQ